MTRSGSRGGQLGDETPTHRVTGEDRLLDAEGVEDATEEVGVGREVAAAGRQALGTAVPGGVDGDDLEPDVDEAPQRLGVQHALGGEAVDEDERHALAAHGDADPVPVGQRRRGVGPAGAGG